MSDPHHDSEPTAFDQEIDYGKIRSFGFGLLLVTLVSMAVTWWVVVSARNEARSQDAPLSPLAQAAETWEPPGPQLQEFPPTLDMAALRAWEQGRLNHFAEVDGAEGMIRIPIDQAIDILAVRGFPERGDVEAVAHEVFGGVRTQDVSPIPTQGAQ
ncbi:MAG: hypothetical protein K0U98_23120 [Deltaproteobacteria bacterium]|nr:hypothetical protein [Deltaproteobacteria bacterium]